MTERKLHLKQGQRRHRKNEINIALFLFQTSYLGNYQDLNEVITSDKIRSDRRWLVLNARDAEGIPILINCLKGSSKKEDEKDHLECIKILVSQQLPLDATDSSGKTVIHWAVLLDKLEICRFLLQKGSPVDILDNAKMSPIHIAISKRSEDFVGLLCEYGPPEILESVDNMGRTPLCHSLFVHCTKVFQKLLQAGANPNGETNNGKKLMAHCIENPTLKEFLNMLLQHNAKLFNKEASQISMIHRAACQKDSSSLNIISKYCTQVELNSTDQFGKTPLMYATYNGHVDNVKILLREQVDSSILDLEGKSALHYTEKNTTSDCVQLLVNYDPSLLNKCSKLHKYPIHYAIMMNNPVVLNALLESGGKPDLIDEDGHTLVHYATAYCALACLPELAKLGLSVNVPDKHGAYPIHYAVRLEAEENMKKKYELLKKLIEIGAKLNVADCEGLQAIHWAVSMGNYDALKLLLIEDADVNATTKAQKYTPLHLACLSSKLDCFELLLLQPDIIVDARDNKGYTPLIYACQLSESKYVELLLEAGADPNAQGADGRSAAHNAAGNATVDCLWRLSLKKANLDCKNNKGETPMHLACVNPNEECFRFLLNRKCDVNATYDEGVTPLHIAVTNKNSQRARLLLQNNANCNAIVYGKGEYTPLDIALLNADYDCITLLQQDYKARTAHHIINHAALSIQHWWKKYKKKNNVNNAGFQGSMCDSSNASESISVREAKKYQRQLEEAQQSHNNNLNNKLVLPKISYQREVVGARSARSVTSNGSSKSMMYAIPDYDDWMSGKKQREHDERIARGEEEIRLMRELMKDTEKILTRARKVNEEANELINSQALRKIKQANREYMAKQRKEKEANPLNSLDKKSVILDKLVEEHTHCCNAKMFE